MNDYYVNELGKVNKERYIDTSVVMKPRRLNKFIVKAKEELIKNNIKIIVSKPVVCELIKHTLGDDKDKKELAAEGLDILNNNKDIFIFEDEIDGDFKKTFADKELLATLMNNRSSKSQMLITNDRELANDANKINDMKSVSGGYVYVCYLDQDGELQKSDTEEVEQIVEETPSVVAEPSTIEYSNASKTFKKIGYYTLFGTICFCLGRNSDQIVSYLNNLNKKVFA